MQNRREERELLKYINCHNPIFDLSYFIIIILFTEKDKTNDDKKNNNDEKK